MADTVKIFDEVTKIEQETVYKYFTIKIQTICATQHEDQLKTDSENVFFTYDESIYTGTAYMFIYCPFIKNFKELDKDEYENQMDCLNGVLSWINLELNRYLLSPASIIMGIFFFPSMT